MGDHPRFKCPIKTTKSANDEFFFDKVEMLFGKENCKIEIQGTVVWAWLGNTFYFQSPLSEEDLDTVNNCFAEGTQIVDSAGTDCVSLMKKKECKKDKDCDWKKKTCIEKIEKPEDPCADKKKKECKKKNGCKYSAKKKECKLVKCSKLDE